MKKAFQYNLEALRGWVAILVVLTHCFGFSEVLNNAPRVGFWQYDFPGHLAVMIFFSLSGFVIGISTKQIQWHTVNIYLTKRFFRLYPIYFLCVIVALLVTTHSYSWWQIIANFCFLQVAAAESLYEVGVNWSLNYEVLFYLLFIPLSVYAIKPVKAAVFILLSGVFLQFGLLAEQPAMYCYGFCHWLAGLWLAKETISEPQAYSRYTLAGLSCMILVFPNLNAVAEVMRFQLHSDDFGSGSIYNPIAVTLSDFSYLPFSILLLTVFTGRRFKWQGLLTTYVILVPLAFLALQLRHAPPVNWLRVIPSCIFMAISIVLLLLGSFRHKNQETTRQLPDFIIHIGSISYGIYLIHFLVLLAVSRFYFLPTGTSISLVVRTGVVLCITVAAGYILEKIWHPTVMKWLKPMLDRLST